MISNDDIMIIFWFKNFSIFPVNRVTNYNDKAGSVSQGGSNPLVTCFSGLVKSTSFISQGGLNPLVTCFSGWDKSTGSVSQGGYIHCRFCFSGWVEFTGSVSQGELNPLVLFLRVG